MEKNIDAAYSRYVQMVYKICYMYFNGNRADAEDAVSETFLKYIEYSGDLETNEHEKAWLIVTAQNTCKSMLRKASRKHISLDDLNEHPSYEVETSDVMEKILQLPENHKMAIYLHYYEGYSGAEIAKMMGIRENTVFSWLHKGRKKLEKMLGE